MSNIPIQNPFSLKGNPITNLDAIYGPYSAEGNTTAKQKALLEIGEDGYDRVVAGLTVGIVENGEIVEYWLQKTNDGNPDIEDSKSQGYNLVKKQAVDNALSSSSENPVQNKVVKQALDAKQNKIDSNNKLPYNLLSDTPTIPDVTDKVDKVSNATVDNFVVFDSNGGIKDSWKKASNFATAVQGTKADSAIQGITRGDTALTPDANKIVDIPEEILSVVANDVAAGGNPTATLENGTLTLGIPRGADAVNPFKGYFDSLSDLQAKYPTGETGDFANVYDSTADKTYRYVWDASLSTPAWTQQLDSSSQPIEVTPSTATFATGRSIIDTSIVNDLITGGATDVASAETVKTIAETTMDLVEGANIFDPNTIDSVNRLNISGGLTAASSTFFDYGAGCTDFIEIPTEGLVINHAMALHGSTVPGLCIYSAKNTSNFVEYKNATSDGASYVIDPTGHPNWKYVRFNILAGYDYETDGVAIYKGIFLPTPSFQPYEEPSWSMKVVDNLISNERNKPLSAYQGKLLNEKDAEKISVKATLNGEVMFVPRYGKNRCNPAEIVSGYIKASDGKLYPSSQTTSTGYILVQGNNLYCNNGVADGSKGWASYRLATAEEITDSNVTKFDVDGKQYVLSHGTSSSGNQHNYTYQDGDVYVRFSLSSSTDVQVEIGTAGTAYEPYNAPVFVVSNVLLNIPRQVVTVDDITPTSYDYNSANMCDPQEAVFETKSYITCNTGLPGHSDGSGYASFGGYTGFIPIDKEGLFCNHGMIMAGTTIGHAVYDINGNFLQSQSVYGSNTQHGGNTYVEWTEGAAFVRFTLDSTATNSNVIVCKGTTAKEYVAYEWKRKVISKDILPKAEIGEEQLSDAINTVLNEGGYYPSTVTLSLPDKIWAVRGDRLQIFYQGIVVCPNIELYDITIVCNKGKGLYRYYEWNVPENETINNNGIDWTINVKDANGNLLATKTCKLCIIDKASSPLSNKNILCIGDSLTAEGIWPHELKRRLVGTQGNPTALGIDSVTFIGSKSRTLDDMTVNFEGNGGWSWADYDDEGRPRYRFYLDGIYDVSNGAIYTNNGKSYTVIEVNNESGNTVILTSSSAHGNTITGTTLAKSSGNGDSPLTFTQYHEEGANPFWNDGQNKLDFVNYVENVCNLPSATLIDYAYFLMTWNAVPGVNGDWDSFMASVKTVIDALHADYPNCKIKLMGMQFIYPPTFISSTSSQDGFGNIKRIAKMNELYQELANSTDVSGTSPDEYNTFVEFVNVSTQFDSKYNMTNVEKDVNTRNSTYKERFTNNSIHPATTGYLQIADVAYRNICKDLS